LKTPFPVAASIAQRPGYGGHACAFLQFAWGLAELGYAPLFVDRLSDEMVCGEDGLLSRRLKEASIRWFVSVMEEAGLEGSYSLLLDDGEAVGVDRAAVKQAIADAPALINVMGFLQEEDLLEAARKRVFLDVDPGFPHIWSELGLADPFAGHDRFVTVGGNVGSPGCLVPTRGLEWVAIRPPVCLDRWPAAAERPKAPFRSVGSWRGPYGPVEYEGRTLGLRVHEFRKFYELPERVEAPFEVALDIDPADSADIERLKAHGWQLADSAAAADSLAGYQRFVRDAGAEIGIAKNIYVDTDSGWFSDRSACFLASGRPVLVQDTGFGRHLPVGEGLVSFGSVDEAVAGAEAILGDQGLHSREARALAEEFFDAKTVLHGMLGEIDVA
jgi:hypothetical protein